MAHDLRALGAAIVKDIIAGRIQHGEMCVQAGARIISIGFRHEAGGKAVPPCEAAHQHLEQPGIIGRTQSIIAMHHINLELAQTCLGDGGIGGNVHFLAGVVKIGEEFVELVKRADAERLGALAPFA